MKSWPVATLFLPAVAGFLSSFQSPLASDRVLLELDSVLSFTLSWFLDVTMWEHIFPLWRVGNTSKIINTHSLLRYPEGNDFSFSVSGKMAYRSVTKIFILHWKMKKLLKYLFCMNIPFPFIQSSYLNTQDSRDSQLSSRILLSD